MAHPASWSWCVVLQLLGQGPRVLTSSSMLATAGACRPCKWMLYTINSYSWESEVLTCRIQIQQTQPIAAAMLTIELPVLPDTLLAGTSTA
jgi:hypothetical protein